MAKTNKVYIGLKQIFYGDIITTEVTRASIKTWLESATEVTNVHEGTWSYTQDDPDVTDYVNELTGQPYYRDKTSQGAKTVNFTLGAYAYEDKVALQGGTLIKESDAVVGWKAPTKLDLIYKGIVAITKTGTLIVFPYASIVGKSDAQEKNLGLGITAVAMDPTTEGMAGEYWLDEDND